MDTACEKGQAVELALETWAKSAMEIIPSLFWQCGTSEHLLQPIVPRFLFYILYSVM